MKFIHYLYNLYFKTHDSKKELSIFSYRYSNRWKNNELIPNNIPNNPVQIGAATVCGISSGYTIQEIQANQNPIVASSEKVSKSLHCW